MARVQCSVHSLCSCGAPPCSGGRSTRDFIEENVVEAIAEALDGYSADEGRAALALDVEDTPHDPDALKFVCHLR